MKTSEVEELCGKPEVTPEVLMHLLNEQWFFEQAFQGNVSPNQREPLWEWVGKEEK